MVYSFGYSGTKVLVMPMMLNAVQVVCAGSQDSFEIFVWSVKTGRLLEVRSTLLKSHDLRDLLLQYYCISQTERRRGAVHSDYPAAHAVTQPHMCLLRWLVLDALHDCLCHRDWRLQNSQTLMQVLSGHEGPVAGLVFSPTGPLLASASWDHTLRTWDVFAGKGASLALVCFII